MIYWNVLIISFLSLLATFITGLINFGLLSAIFITKKLKKSEELTFFYARFAIDVLFGVSSDKELLSAYHRDVSDSTNLLFVLFYYTGFQDFLNSNRNLIFYISWPSINLITIRALLVFVITTDRTMAVYTPISYHNYRRKVPNLLIFIFLFGFLVFNNLMLWVICDYRLIVPIGCIGFGCASNTCYVSFWMGYEQVIYSLIAITSILLVLKLFIWNNCSKTAQKSPDLSRANRLAVIDTFVIFAFDLFPSALSARLIRAKFEDIGPIGSLFKSIGFLIEGIMVVMALKRRNHVEQERSTRSIGKVKTSVMT